MIFSILGSIPVLFLAHRFVKRKKDRKTKIIFRVLVCYVVAMCLLLIGALFVPAWFFWLAVWLAVVKKNEKKRKTDEKAWLPMFGNLLIF